MSLELENKEESKEDHTKQINYLHLVSVEDNLDKLLGFYYWKRYVAAAFWSNISTPINLAITLMTAMTTAQAATLNLFSNSITSTISIVTFALTVINTFFKPHLQMTQNIGIMEQWNSVGVDFELIFYDNNKYNEYELFIEKYQKIQERINEIRKMDGPDTINFLTDLIHMISTKCCLKDINWLDHDIKDSFRKNLIN